MRLLILDEPTAALNDEESEKLLNLLKEFQKQGLTSIIISHKLNEVQKVADEITILRDGATIETLVGAAWTRSRRTASSAAWSAAIWPTASRRANPMWIAAKCLKCATGRCIWKKILPW